jgi:hypothetical protein
MNEPTSTRKELVTREAILDMLSDDEVASVCTAETAAKLEDKAEYLDLDQLEKGIQRATNGAVVMGRALPKKAVHEATWKKIQAALASMATAGSTAN